MDKDSFVFHRDFMDELWDEPEERLKWYDRIFHYALNNVDPEITDRNERKAWGNVKSHIDSDRESWEKRLEYQKQKNEERKKMRNNSNVSNISNISNVSNNSNVSNILDVSTNTPHVFESESEFVSEFESVSVFESEFDRERDTSCPAPSTKRFQKPTIEEIKEYVSKKSYTFSPEAFFNFYESNGWKVGKNSMKDWKAACKTWQQREPKQEIVETPSHVDYNSDEWKQEDW